MSDPAIKLFGKTIQLPDSIPDSPEYSGAKTKSEILVEDEESLKDQFRGELDESKDDKELKDQNLNTTKSDTVKEPPADNDCSTTKTSKSEEQYETSNSQEKILKKPDKILPCPRCNSMETKFCYFNNYNVSQPRHFCKKCQRYWTAGGTMRNVPVGAGRRKIRSTVLHYRHVSDSETLPSARPGFPNGIRQPIVKANGSVLTFGSDTPLCESMASGLNIAEKMMQNSSRNGFQKPEELGMPVSYGAGHNVDDHSKASSVTAASSKDKVNKIVPDMLKQNCHSFPSYLPCFPGAPWPYPLSSGQWSSVIPPPGYCPPGFPMSFYPAAMYWGCSLPGSWNVPSVSPPTASLNHTPPTSGPNSPTLGKHSRDEDILKPPSSEENPQRESNPEKCLWVPKTLRIDDPGDAAKSSIWATLGIKHDSVNSVGGGIFKAFQSKDDGNSRRVSETSILLQANPAALSRSLNFNESS